MAVYTCSNCSTRSSPRNLRIYFVSTKRKCEHPSKHAAYFFTEHVSTNTPTKTILIIACNFRGITHNEITYRKFNINFSLSFTYFSGICKCRWSRGSNRQAGRTCRRRSRALSWAPFRRTGRSAAHGRLLPYSLANSSWLFDYFSNGEKDKFSSRKARSLIGASRPFKGWGECALSV